jgi:hypothetical protein
MAQGQQISPLSLLAGLIYATDWLEAQIRIEATCIPEVRKGVKPKKRKISGSGQTTVSAGGFTSPHGQAIGSKHPGCR